MTYVLNNISEIIYSVGDLHKTHHFFCNYGGWTSIEQGTIGADILSFWDLGKETDAIEELLQFDDEESGRIRLVRFENVHQQYIRSSQKPWDTGGIMDINLRVNNVRHTFEELRDLGWHGLSDPLFQKMGPFELYDILMQGYDDIIVAFTHRTKPPLQLKPGFKIPSHVYNSSIVVKDLAKARSFYTEQLGFQLLNEYEVVKDTPQENMFGIPQNIIPNVRCEANILSLNGQRDTIFQLIQFHGITGKDFSEYAVAPNRGFLMYRCAIEGIDAYFNQIQQKINVILKPVTKLEMTPYGSVRCFAIRCPDGVRWEFFEKYKSQIMAQIEVGQKAPDFKVVGTDMQPIQLSDYTGKNLILHFFPLAFTGICTAQMCTARDEEHDYTSLNAEVVGVSVDSPFVLQKFATEHNLNFKLGSDFNRETCRAFGVLFDGDFLGLSEFAKRSAFVIDKEGVIKYAEVTDGKSLPNFEAIKATLAGA